MTSAVPAPTPAASRHRFDATVVFNKPLCREHYLLRLRIARDDASPAFPPTRPGEFIQLGCRTPNGFADADRLLGGELEWSPDQPPRPTQPEVCGRLALLRRPFSLAGRGEDAQGTWIEIVHRVVGVGTAWLEQLKPGDPVDFIGPLGNRFTLPPGKSIALLVGGGVGLPPMFYLAEAIAQADWKAIAFVGALTHDLLAVTFRAGVAPSGNGTPTRSVEEFAKHGFDAVITTDDGTLGLRGRITTGVERTLAALSPADAAKAVVFTCGPEPMMHAVAKLAEKHGVECQVCLEQAMACGMGTCQSCIVKIDPRKFHPEKNEPPHGTRDDGRPWRFKLACTDGPVFDSQSVVW